MSVFTSLGILALAVLIQVFLQLTPAVFSIFLHNTLGKYTKAQASHLSIFFIIGTETITALLFMSVYFILQALFTDQFGPRSDIFYWAIAGILFALSLASFFIYFRKGRGTQLFISRKSATELLHKTETIKTGSDAFMLGAFASLQELLFTLPLYVVASLEITEFPGTSFSRAGLIILYILITLLPLFVIHSLYATDHNLAHVQKLRTKYKLFFRLIISICYLLLALSIIIFRIFA